MNGKIAFKNVLLIKPLKNRGSASWMDIIPLGLEYLAAYIQKHVQKVDIVDLAKDPHSIEHYLNKLKPDLVGISITYSIEHNESLELARKAKQAGASVVVGGYHATGLAEELAFDPNIDFVVRGEGEETLLELVQKGTAEDIKGLSYFKENKVIHNPDRPLIKDLDSISFPARNLRKYKYEAPFFFAKGYDAIMTSRGCWGKCKFCCEPMMCKGTQRYRKPKEVIREIEEILKSRKEKELMIHILDPNFAGNPRIAEKICDKLIEVKTKYNISIKFGAPVRVDVIGNNRDLVKKMLKAGIDLFNLGIESPNNNHLQLMNKKTTRDLQEKATRNIIENGGKVYGTFVVGFPYQTEEDIRECFEYAKYLQIDYSMLCIATPLPGTELFKELRSKKLLIEKDWDKYDYVNLVFKHDSFTKKQWRELFLRSGINFHNDLFLKTYYKEASLQKKKHKLYKLAMSFSLIINTSMAYYYDSLKSNSNNDVSLIDHSIYLKEFINPNLKKFTEEKGVHNIFEISRLLKILGPQKIQITANIRSKPIVSWVIKTSKGKVDYIETICGNEKGPSIIINIHLEDLFGNKDLPNIKKQLFKNILKDNKGFKNKLNLLRLLAAIWTEVLSYKIDKMMENWNN